jgi:glycosyltransferase involved in cell wall biosynthesis
MKILAVLTCDPFSREYGGTYAVRGTLAALAKVGDLYVTGYGPNFGHRTIGTYNSCGSLGEPANSPLSFLASLCSRKSYSLGKYSSHESQFRFRKIVDTHKFDVIWYEHTHAAAVGYFSGIMSHRPRQETHVVRMHNLEWQVVKDRPGALAKLGKVLLSLEANYLHKYEIEIARAADHVLTISEEDRDTLSADCPALINKTTFLPASVQIQSSKAPARERSARVLFVGNCSWGPNLQSAKWVIDHLAPQLQHYLPGLTVRIVGERTESLRARARTPNIHCAGFVQDIASEYRSALCTVAPVWAGGGVNIKVLDSLGNGVPVIGTKFARRGVNSEAFLIAETPTQFVERIHSLLLDSSLAEKLSSLAVSSMVELNRHAEIVLNTVLNTSQSCHDLDACFAS